MQYSIVNYKTVKEKSDFRIDADYFEPRYQKLEKFLFGKGTTNLNDYSVFIKKGIFDISPNNYVEKEGVAFLRSGDLKDEFISSDEIIQISKESHEKEKKTELVKNDLLMAKVGTIGDVAINLRFEKLNFSQNVMGIKIKKEYKPISGFLLSFLNCSYGRNQVNRVLSGQVQQKLTLEDIKKVKIVNLKGSIQKLISELVSKAYLLKDKSNNFYSQAEQLLLSELGLTDLSASTCVVGTADRCDAQAGWKPKPACADPSARCTRAGASAGRHELSFIKNFSDTQEAERFDAEYFQPKYEEIIEAMKKYLPAEALAQAGKGGFDDLGNLVKIKKSIEPGSEAYQEEGIPFVRVSNLSKLEIGTNNQQFLSDELYETLKKHQPKKGEILLSKDATPGIAYLLNEEPQKMIVSGGILRLKDISQEVLPEYLTLVLNSVIVQKQIEQYAGGSIINHWRPDQVKATVIPILKEDKQKEIKELIEKSFVDRKLSKFLLEIAKRGVEMAIEKNEQEAENWINSEIEKLGIKI